jgi:hypothetical protein
MSERRSPGGISAPDARTCRDRDACGGDGGGFAGGMVCRVGYGQRAASSSLGDRVVQAAESCAEILRAFFRFRDRADLACVPGASHVDLARSRGDMGLMINRMVQ